MRNKIIHCLGKSIGTFIAYGVILYSYICLFLKNVSIFWIKNRIAICEGAIAALSVGLLILIIPIYEPFSILAMTLLVFALAHNVDAIKNHSERIFLFSYSFCSIVSRLHFYFFNLVSLDIILIYTIMFFPFYFLFKKACT